MRTKKRFEQVLKRFFYFTEKKLQVLPNSATFFCYITMSSYIMKKNLKEKR
ncbi:hypothetical protein GMMP15_30002 [Candidatus Magnetomoraceae bacterium gMMP-15]